MYVQSRIDFVNCSQLCRLCLKSGHNSNKCTLLTYRIDNWGEKHNNLLHLRKNIENSRNENNNKKSKNKFSRPFDFLFLGFDQN